MGLHDWLSSIRTLDANTKEQLRSISEYTTLAEKERVEEILRAKQAKTKQEQFPVERCLPARTYPILKSLDAPDETTAFIESINSKIRSSVQQEQEREFSRYAKPFLEANLAPEIIGVDAAKQAIILQLLTKQLHILLIGEHAEKLLAAACALSPNAISGTSDAIQPDKELTILAKANNGLCCITMATLKPGARTALHQVMEHGYVRRDYGIQHENLPAQVSILAATKKPLEKTLQSRFHFVFPMKQAVVQKIKSLSAADIQFIQHYLARAQATKPRIAADLVEKLEGKPLIAALAVAAAKLELREEVLRRDVEAAQQMVLS